MEAPRPAVARHRPRHRAGHEGRGRRGGRPREGEGRRGAAAAGACKLVGGDDRATGHLPGALRLVGLDARRDVGVRLVGLDASRDAGVRLVGLNARRCLLCGQLRHGRRIRFLGHDPDGIDASGRRRLGDAVGGSSRGVRQRALRCLGFLVVVLLKGRVATEPAENGGDAIDQDITGIEDGILDRAHGTLLSEVLHREHELLANHRAEVLRDPLGDALGILLLQRRRVHIAEALDPAGEDTRVHHVHPCRWHRERLRPPIGQRENRVVCQAPSTEQWRARAW
mmetsp:Transcript_109864/g.295561  ORF Transcript_109864/g.295561 Transcript_109864/m.295561 type:complete len:282 (+) Transcript_109864:728-1573(+)